MKRSVVALAVLSLGVTSTGVVFGGKWVKHAGELYAINVPGRIAGEKVSLSVAQDAVSTYRWIYVNASLKDLQEAKAEATKLSNALSKRPMIVVFMPRHVGDGQRNDYHPNFQASLAALIRHAMKDNKELLVSARSYGVSQALRVIVQFNSPRILLTGIAPAFGAFGSQGSANVKQHIRDIQNTRSKYCMIASKDDGFTWRAGGAAYKRRISIRGDNDVYRAMKKNTANVHLILLDGADHAPVDEYLRHGLVNAMRQAADHFRMTKTPVGDIVYGRKPPPTDAGTASTRTPGGRTPTGRTPTGRTPSGRTPSGRTPEPTPRRVPQDPTRFTLRFTDAYLVRTPSTRPVQIAGAGAVLSYGSDWEVRRVQPCIYHLRSMVWKTFFWEANTTTGRAYKVTGGTFGRIGGRRELLRGVRLTVQAGRAAPPPAPSPPRRRPAPPPPPSPPRRTPATP